MSSLMPETQDGPTYWRSLDERSSTPEFQEFVKKEFPGLDHELPDGVSRRKFLQIMGASMALAGMAACRWPEEKIVPFTSRPEGFVPGQVEHYATSWDFLGTGQGLTVASYDGRPIKIEGNDNHPGSLGGTSMLAQATILDMYDPDRSRAVKQRGADGMRERSWAAFEEFANLHFRRLRDNGGEGFHILTEAYSSPSLQRLRAAIQSAFPKAVWVEYEPFSLDNERAGIRLASGKALLPVLFLEKARTVVSFDSDILNTHPSMVRYSRNFIDGRRNPESGEMNRLYCIEAVHSLTGAMADHRIIANQSQIATLIGGLAAELVKHGLTLPGSLGASVDRFSGVTAPWMAPLAKELLTNRGASLLTAGGRIPDWGHGLVAALNDALGNAGKTVSYRPDPNPERPHHQDAIRELAAALNGGRVDTLLMLGGNPAFNAPGDVEFAAGLARAGTAIHLSMYEDETSMASHWHLPMAHFLECWGDTAAYDGTWAPQQPLIAPLWGGRSPIEVTTMILDGRAIPGFEVVQRTFQGTMAPDDLLKNWREALHDGIRKDSQAILLPVSIGFDDLAKALSAAPATLAATGGMEVIITQDLCIHDGRFANNGWLQELPDPMSKVTWENVALFGPKTMESLHAETVGQLLRVRTDSGSVEISSMVLPGVAPNTLVISAGYGRKMAAGRVANGPGVNVYPLTRAGASFVTAQVTNTKKTSLLAHTANHHLTDSVGTTEIQRRVPTLIREGTLAEYKVELNNAEFAQDKGPFHEPVYLWKPLDFEAAHQWGMAIDLNACTGCNACVISCQAENNIPIVGKEQVRRGREMHWIRVDRYYRGEHSAPMAVHQPVPCMHCETAPCEQVCPVAATTHDEEGLNAMVYNRCIGTRYCSNNCPYKVRRFNYFNLRKEDTPERAMQYNPEVTVRMRGVMEKCTYCTQRITKARVKAKNEGRLVADGELKTACSQACPTRAIVFGNLADANSSVAKLHANNRTYTMIQELMLKTRTKYMAKLRNPNPELAERTT